MGELVLFASLENAGRTQMAAGWFNLLAHPDRARAICAGTQPKPSLAPGVADIMREVGIDIAGQQPQALTPLLLGTADLVIAFPPLDEAEVTSTALRDTWLVEELEGKPPSRVREIRHEIEGMVRKLLVARHWLPFGASTPPSL